MSSRYNYVIVKYGQGGTTDKKVESIQLTPNSINIEVGESITLTPTIVPPDATNKSLQWSANNSNVTVDQTGKVTAVSSGNCTVTATAKDGSGVSGSSTIIISEPVTLVSSITLNPNTIELEEGETSKITATVLPSTATNKSLQWSANNGNVTVDQSGNITAVSSGNCIITATAKDGSGVSGSSSIVVSKALPKPIAAWSAEGKTNEDEDRAILKDLTGNGHDITLNGFAFNTEGSGYGHSDYPDALVFDGVDDYGINKTVPKIDDFTLILKATVLNKSGTNAIISKDINYPGAFSLRWDKVLIYNYSNHILFTDGINYLTPNIYNGTNVNKGIASDQLGVNIGCIRAGFYLCNMAFYSAYLFDRSLDEQEIKAFIRKYIDPEYLLPSEIPTPDCYYDFSQGSNDDETRDTIKDLSGNGNDAVAHNFAWNEEGSGYKDGALHFDGVDDYISLDAFDSGFNTMFMVCYNLIADKYTYEQRNTSNDNYALTTFINGYSRINKNPYYINGIYVNSTPDGERFRNKKHCVTVVCKQVDNGAIPKIGCARNLTSFQIMKLYKFLGFKEALTEEQINAIIKKYNLLDGVDEIEVN